MPEPTHIAVACAFSPRLRAVLAEAWHFASHFSARFSIMHAGERTAEKEEQLRTVTSGLGLPAEASTLWGEGDPVRALVTQAKAANVDLLVAGALERDIGPHFLSGVARGLLRDADCSLLLFPKPSEAPQALRKIVVMTDFTECAREALRLALLVAEREKAETLHVLSVISPFTAARAKFAEKNAGLAHSGQDEEAMLDEFASFAADSPVPIDTRVIHTTTGMGAADFAKSIEADLLVVPATTKPDGQTQLPTYMDWVTQVIPCNLWVVKLPKTES